MKSTLRLNDKRSNHIVQKKIVYAVSGMFRVRLDVKNFVGKNTGCALIPTRQLYVIGSDLVTQP